MTAVLSASPSPTSSPRDARSPTPNLNLSTLPPLNTNAPPRRSPLQRPPSFARNRMSAYSTTSNAPQQIISRPQSTVFPFFHSHLPYALVRDFAYPVHNQNHYGPQESSAQSGSSTPMSDIGRRLSEPVESTWENDTAPWSAGPWAGEGAQQLPQMTYGDGGPPYSEDDDLHSPVVVSSSHKKQKSSGSGRRGRKSQSPGEEEDEPEFDGERGYFAGQNGDGNATYYRSSAETGANGPGGELVTYPPDRLHHSLLAPSTYSAPGQRDSHFAGPLLPSRSYKEDEEDSSEPSTSPRPTEPKTNDSRYSKDYQFTIASPDEEMHGKAVALFDFKSENENELALVEGQVIWVSYRQLQGWLVAQDPKTDESGLVPEAYVRLLKDIEGGWPSIEGKVADKDNEDKEKHKGNEHSPVSSPIQTEQSHSNGNVAEKRPPVVSTFSTSSKDLSPYPLRLPTGQTPPPVTHYGSQNNTPTVSSAPLGSLKRGPSQSKHEQSVTEEEEEDSSDEGSEDGDGHETRQR